MLDLERQCRHTQVRGVLLGAISQPLEGQSIPDVVVCRCLSELEGWGERLVERGDCLLYYTSLAYLDHYQSIPFLSPLDHSATLLGLQLVEQVLELEGTVFLCIYLIISIGDHS